MPTAPTAPVLNVAAISSTTVLGPGLRAAVWVQGCPFDCPGCMAPEWIPDTPAHAMGPAELAVRLLARPGIEGLTLSGGEPMRQAAGLAALCDLLRARVPALDVICFTGYRLARLRRDPPGPGVADLLDRIDVLIDGRYVAALDDGRGLRGSANQTVHHLTGRLRHLDGELTAGPRSAEVVFRGGGLVVTGVPPAGLLAALDHAAPRVPPQPTAAPEDTP